MSWFQQRLQQARLLPIFSSPLGDGLVLTIDMKNKSLVIIFVPEWGWVGSTFSRQGWCVMNIFVPEWGWVGSADFNRNFKKSSNTI